MNNSNTTTNPSENLLLRLPPKTEQILFLIREELKSRKLFWALCELGLDNCYFLPHLDDLILQGIGLDASDETYDAFTHIMDRRSKKIEASRKSVTRHALKAYHELLNEKAKRKHMKAAAPVAK